VLRVGDITDFGALKQAAVLLETTVTKLQSENAKLRLENALLGGAATPLTQASLLEEQLAKLQAMCFGPSSEKRPKDEPDSVARASDEVESKPAQSGHGPTSQPRLQVEVKTYELAEADCTCSTCGKPLLPKPGMEQVSEMITVVGVEFKLEKVTQTVYGCDCPEALVTAPGPDRAIPGGRYSLEFAAFVAEQKYLDHLPLARQERMMERNGRSVTRTALWDQVNALAGLLEPSWKALHHYTLGADWVHCDETYWPMLDGPGTAKWWTWCLASADSVFYAIHPHRSAKAARAILADFEGVLITDGYGAYHAALRDGPRRIVHAHCWSHVRRKFLEAEASYPDLTAKPIAWIGRLFDVERALPKIGCHASQAERAPVLEARRAARQTHSRPVADELRQWGYDILPTLLPSTGMAKALEYMLSLWPGLTVFLTDPRIPIDNNHAEREIRGVVVGRKNHYGSKSKRGTEVAAIFYSLCESARLAGIDPKSYLLEAARRAIRTPGAVTLPADLVTTAS
jgi:transposase